MRDVPDVSVTVEGKHVVFAQRVELDGSLDDLADAAIRPAVAFGREGRQELWIAFVACGRFEKRMQIAAGCRAGPWCVEVHAEGLQDLRGVALEPLPLVGADAPRADLLPMRCLFRIKR